MRKEVFMQYMTKEFQPMKNNFTYDLVSNIVDYVLSKYKGKERDEMLLRLIPQITEDDLRKLYVETGEIVGFTVGSMTFYYYVDTYREYPNSSHTGFVAYGYNERKEKRAFDFDESGRLKYSWEYGKEPWRKDYFGGQS